MTRYSGSVTYGKQSIAFDVVYVDRKTMEIAVHPGARVVVKAPTGTTPVAVQKRVVKRARWIRKQINYFLQFEPRTPPRRYVGGETHLFLGRQYRLRIKKQHDNIVKLKGANFYVMTPAPDNKQKVKRLLTEWYQEHAREIFSKRLQHCYETAKRLGVPYPKVRLKKMSKRWGSCSKAGDILLNTELVKAPLYCIDYVIMHELCHLKEHTHSNGYYKLLSKYMPDWEKRKERLERLLTS
jgi:predicted metal-dependent hydrolase